MSAPRPGSKAEQVFHAMSHRCSMCLTWDNVSVWHRPFTKWEYTAHLCETCAEILGFKADGQS